MIEWPATQQIAVTELEKHLHLMKPGRTYVFTAKEKRAKRSTGKNSANAHLNGHVQQLCESIGDTDFDSIKDCVKRKAVGMGLPFKTLKNGDILPMRERDSDSFECYLMIEAAHLLAAEEGIFLKEE